jgi:hypothetical protein
MIANVLTVIGFVFVGLVIGLSILLLIAALLDWLTVRRRRSAPTPTETMPLDMDEARVVLTNMLTQMSETMEVVNEAAAGYRANLEARGYSPTAAEVLAVEYHRSLVRMLFKVANQEEPS